MVVHCRACGAENDGDGHLCRVCGAVQSDTVDLDETNRPPVRADAGSTVDPPFPSLPDGGLATAMPAWLRPTAPAVPLRPRSSPNAQPARPDDPTDLSTFISEDDLPEWLRRFADREVIQASPHAKSEPPRAPEIDDYPRSSSQSHDGEQTEAGPADADPRTDVAEPRPDRVGTVPTTPVVSGSGPPRYMPEVRTSPLARHSAAFMIAALLVLAAITLLVLTVLV